MTISATILADSVMPNGKRVTTFSLVYGRMIHSELMTHRQFSRNASSSRARPNKTVIQEIRDNPATFVHWGANQPGMQANAELSGWRLAGVKLCWHLSMRCATFFADVMSRLGAHKQVCNRATEPYSHIHVVVTSTEWSNFYALRRHPDAQPEIKALADCMYAAHQASTPTLLQPGEWHLPYVTAADRIEAEVFIAANPDFSLPTRFIDDLPIVIDQKTQFLLAVSVARCARTSYKLHDGKPTTIGADIKLYARLLSSQPLHASPAEHQATPLSKDADVLFSGNLRGVIQFRKLLIGETI